MNHAMRIEEIPVVADFTLTSYTRDKDDFEAFSADYGDVFKLNFETKIAAVKAVESTRFHTAEINALTVQLYKDMVSLRPKLRFLAKYAKNAKAQLTVGLKYFGIQQVREELKNMDTEALSQALKELMENVDIVSNMAALTAKGFKPAAYTALNDLKTKIYDENQQQNTLMNDRALAVQENSALFKELTDIIIDVQEVGKALYFDTDKARLNEYTMTKLLNRIRQEQDAAKAELEKIMNSCAVYANYTDELGAPLADVTTTIIEYELVVQSDDEGTSYFEQVPTEPYDKVTVKSELENYVTDIKYEVALTAGGEVEGPVVMKLVVVPPPIVVPPIV